MCGHTQVSLGGWQTAACFPAVTIRPLQLTAAAAVVAVAHVVAGIYNKPGVSYRMNADDMNRHATWQANLRSSLPTGSTFRVEMVHNGELPSGAVRTGALRVSGWSACTPPGSDV